MRSSVRPPVLPPLPEGSWRKPLRRCLLPVQTACGREETGGRPGSTPTFASPHPFFIMAMRSADPFGHTSYLTTAWQARKIVSRTVVHIEEVVKRHTMRQGRKRDELGKRTQQRSCKRHEELKTWQSHVSGALPKVAEGNNPGHTEAKLEYGGCTPPTTDKETNADG